MGQKRYDSTVARVAGNIAAGLMGQHSALVYFAQEPMEATKNTATISILVAKEIIKQLEASNDSQTVDSPGSLVRDGDGTGETGHLEGTER